MPHHPDLVEQGDAVQCVTLITELICSHLAVGIGMCLYDDFTATLGGANLKAGAVFGEGIGMEFVIEGDRDKKLDFAR